MQSTHGKRNWMRFGLAGTLGLAGCLGDGSTETTGALAQPVVHGSSPAWRPITDVADDPAWRMAYGYGRAVAQILQIGVGSCSGAMVSDTMLLTAHHCVPLTDEAVKVRFGYIGSELAQHGYAVDRARTRLMQLGIPETAQASVSDSTLAFVSDARVGPRETRRDVNLVEVSPFAVDITLDDRRSQRVYIPYGDLWGRVPVREYAPAAGRPGYSMSVNTPCGEPHASVVLAPGTTRESTGCVPGYSQCFDTDADMLAGSSGGPFFDQTLQAVIAVNHAEPIQGTACTTYLGTEANTVARVGPITVAYAAPRSVGSFTDDLSARSPSAWAGGSGGTLHVEPCPPGMLVRGLVGSTAASSSYVGNLGIVCAPHRSPYRAGLHNAVVFAPGSHDTDFRIARGERFHEYFAAVRSSTATMHGEQTLALCPPDFYLRGVRVSAAAAVDRVTAIECAHLSDPTRALTLPIGEHIGYLGASSGGQATTLRCGPGAYVSGMDIRAGWHTDGFRLQCSALPSL